MTTPSTPTSTMKEAEQLILELSAAGYCFGWDRALRLPDVSTSKAGTEAAEAALLAFIRSLVEAQPCAVAGEAARDVLSERERQQSVEGWTPEHDDEHDGGEMAVAAACYALADQGKALALQTVRISKLWEWTGWGLFKPKDRRRNLVRAAALLLAEIERIDRLAAPSAVLPLKGEVPTIHAQTFPLTPEQRDTLTAKGVSHIPGRGEGAGAPSVEPRLTEAQLREIREAGEYVANARRGVPVAPSVEPEGQRLVSITVGGSTHTRTADEWLALARADLAAAPVETEQPVAWMRSAGTGSPVITEDFLRACPRYRSDFTVPLYARPLPGGVPTGLTIPHELAQRVAVALDGGCIWSEGSEGHPRFASTRDDFRAALSAGAPSSLQGERK